MAPTRKVAATPTYSDAVASGLRKALTDVRPLQASAVYRRLWIGNTVGQLGQQMTRSAL